MPGATVLKMGELLKAEEGYHEGPRNNETKYGLEYGMNFVAWCCEFQSWGSKHAGAMYLGKPFHFASTIAARDNAKKNKRWTTTPTLGTISMMAHTDKTGHVGFVLSLFKKNGIQYVVTIEGNTNAQGSREGDQVALRTRAASSWDGYIILDETYAPTPQPVLPLTGDEMPVMFFPKYMTQGDQRGIWILANNVLQGVPNPEHFNQLINAGVQVHDIQNTAWEFLKRIYEVRT